MKELLVRVHGPEVSDGKISQIKRRLNSWLYGVGRTNPTDVVIDYDVLSDDEDTFNEIIKLVESTTKIEGKLRSHDDWTWWHHSSQVICEVTKVVTGGIYISLSYTTHKGNCYRGMVNNIKEFRHMWFRVFNERDFTKS
jgi:hypothetical protein